VGRETRGLGFFDILLDWVLFPLSALLWSVIALALGGAIGLALLYLAAVTCG
jgi:hypothetical protein